MLKCSVLFRKVYPTFQAALFGSIVVFFTGGYTLGLDGLAWARSLSFHSTKKSLQEQLLFLNFYGGLIGAWLGAIALPLDWQRDWQVSVFVRDMIERSLFRFIEMASPDHSRCSIWDICSLTIFYFNVYFDLKGQNKFMLLNAMIYSVI